MYENFVYVSQKMGNKGDYSLIGCGKSLFDISVFNYECGFNNLEEKDD